MERYRRKGFSPFSTSLKNVHSAVIFKVKLNYMLDVEKTKISIADIAVAVLQYCGHNAAVLSCGIKT